MVVCKQTKLYDKSEPVFNCGEPPTLTYDEMHAVKRIRESVEESKQRYIKSRIITKEGTEILFKFEYMNNLYGRTVPFIFDRFGEIVLWNVFLLPGYYLDVHNGYLVRKSEFDAHRKPDYFHKFLWEWKRFIRTFEQVNHNDGNIHNNTLANLSVDNEEDEDAEYDAAFKTWSEKTGSTDIEDFENWLALKEES